MSFSRRRAAAITVKELRDYRHNRFVIGTMACVLEFDEATCDMPQLRRGRRTDEPQQGLLQLRLQKSSAYLLHLGMFKPALHPMIGLDRNFWGD